MSSISRRQFLVTVGLGASSAALLAACGKSSSSSSPTTKPGGGATNFGSATLAFSWVDNVQQAGSYVAQQRAYYKATGLDVTFLPGGVTYAGEPLVVSGKALVAMTSPTTASTAVASGAPVTIVGAQYQKSPVCMISLPKKPIHTPADLIGKTIAVQPNIAVEWQAFQQANNLVGKVHSFTTSQDISILPAGQCDGFIGWITNDAVSLQVENISAITMLFADFGLPGFYLTYEANSNTLKDAHGRERIKALLTGEIRGWQDQIANPSIGLQLTLTNYGKSLGLDPKQQQIQSTAQNGLIVSDETKAHGIFWMSSADIQATVESLTLAGSKATPALFDNSLLEEIYAGKSSLP
jgi:ABC-type nitrate/sulfonate/bicarbonate transport system substrate-binding protein